MRRARREGAGLEASGYVLQVRVVPEPASNGRFRGEGVSEAPFPETWFRDSPKLLL